MLLFRPVRGGNKRIHGQVSSHSDERANARHWLIMYRVQSLYSQWWSLILFVASYISIYIYKYIYDSDVMCWVIVSTHSIPWLGLVSMHSKQNPRYCTCQEAVGRLKNSLNNWSTRFLLSLLYFCWLWYLWELVVASGRWCGFSKTSSSKIRQFAYADVKNNCKALSRVIAKAKRPKFLILFREVSWEVKDGGGKWVSEGVMREW